MKTSRRILMAEKLEHVVSFNRANKMTRSEIDRQTCMQKMHNARTKQAFANIKANNKLYAQYGGMYTQNELNLIHDLHPGLKAAYDNKPEDKTMDEVEIAEVIGQVNMFARWTQDSDLLVVL